MFVTFTWLYSHTTFDVTSDNDVTVRTASCPLLQLCSNIAVIWNVMPCSLVDRCVPVRDACYSYLQDKKGTLTSIYQTTWCHIPEDYNHNDMIYVFFMYKQWTDIFFFFHFLVWAFPYLDIGNALYAYNHIDVLTDVFTFMSHVHTKATKIPVLISF